MSLLRKNPAWYWLAATAAFLFEALYYYPHFFYYHADTGWELYSIWAAAQGPGHTDFLMSWRPAYLFNVPFMHYLNFNLYQLRLLFLCVWLSSITVFIAGFDRKYLSNEVLPIAFIIGMSFINFYTDFIVDYYTGIALFLALALGFFWIGLRQNNTFLQKFLLGLAGLSLSLCSLSNVGIIPAAVLTALIIALYYRNRQSLFFAISYALSLLLLAYLYFKIFKVAEVLSHPVVLSGDSKVYHGGFSNLLDQIGEGSFGLVIIYVGIICATLIYYLAKSQKLLTDHRFYKTYPVLAVLSCLLLRSTDINYLFLINLVYCYYMVWLSYLVFYRNGPAHSRSVFLTLCILTLFYLSHRATSNQILGGIVLNYSTLLFISILPLISSVQKLLYRNLCFISFIAGSVVLSFYINFYPSVGDQFSSIRENTINVPELGVKANLETYQLLQNMKSAYYKNNCQNKFFFSFYDAPLPYYLFKRQAPFNQSWVSDNNFYPENFQLNSDTLIQLLNQSQHWCVVYSPTALGDGMPENRRFLQQAHSYIASHASKAVPLGYQQKWGKSYILYVR